MLRRDIRRVATVLTVISQFVPVTLMGFGFLLGASAFLLAAVVRLAVFTDNLPYRVLGAQPIVATESADGLRNWAKRWTNSANGCMELSDGRNHEGKRGKHGKERTNDDG